MVSGGVWKIVGSSTRFKNVDVLMVDGAGGGIKTVTGTRKVAGGSKLCAVGGGVFKVVGNVASC